MTSIITLKRLFCVALMGTGLALQPIIQTSAIAAEPRLEKIIVSDEKDATESDDGFETDTPKIFLTAKMIDVPVGTKAQCSWVAVETKVAPPNYVIDTAEFEVGKLVGMAANVFNCSLSKPNAGWPVGKYRVDLLLDGKKLAEAKFEVE